MSLRWCEADLHYSLKPDWHRRKTIKTAIDEKKYTKITRISLSWGSFPDTPVVRGRVLLKFAFTKVHVFVMLTVHFANTLITIFSQCAHARIGE